MALKAYDFQSMDDIPAGPEGAKIHCCLRYMQFGRTDREISMMMGRSLEWVRRIRDYPLFKEALEGRRLRMHDEKVELFEDYQKNVAKALALKGKMLDEALADTPAEIREETIEEGKVVKEKVKTHAKISPSVAKGLIDSVLAHDPLGTFLPKTRNEQVHRVEIVDTEGILDLRRKAIERHLVQAEVSDEQFDRPKALTQGGPSSGLEEDEESS